MNEQTLVVSLSVTCSFVNVDKLDMFILVEEKSGSFVSFRVNKIPFKVFMNLEWIGADSETL